MEMKKYRIQDREAGNVIDDYTTRRKAEMALKRFEKQDRRDGIFAENFYEIIEI